MALTSPGVEVSIIDESQYIPAATNSVPYVLLATAQNKISGAGVGVAAGTLKVNANKTFLITSQRDLAATYGVPFFYKTTAGTPINGYELNEYGLLAAYSALGVSNRCYVQRVDIDLAELTATLVRPTGSPNNGTYWLDTASTIWGLFEWSQTTNAFANKIPTVITNTVSLEPNTTVPLQTVGAIGDYAIVSTDVQNPGYYKRGGPTTTQTSSTDLSDLYNTWVLIGSDAWKTSFPTVAGTSAPVSLTAAQKIDINGTEITVPASPGNTVVGLANAINTAFTADPVVQAAVIGGKLNLYATSAAEDNGDNYGTGVINITNVSPGTTLATLGITAGLYYAPTLFAGPSFQAPRWSVGQTQPAPTGSVWQKTNSVNLGTNLVVKKYDSVLGTFVAQSCVLYQSTADAIYALDPTGGGANIPAGTTVAQWNPAYATPATLGTEIYERYASGPTIVTGTTTNPTFLTNSQFTVEFTIPGTNNYSPSVTATMAGTDSAAFIEAFSAAVGQTGYSFVSATVNSAGNIVITHSAGGEIYMKNVTNAPLNQAGFTISTPFVTSAPFGYIALSYFVGFPTFEYAAQNTAPDVDPDNGRLWYYSATDQADILIQNNGQWIGYQNCTNDVRGDDLSLTCPTGPIFSATAPIHWPGTTTNVVLGDLWIDTSDLENYPKLYRRTLVNGVGQWVQIDNSDQTTSNGILFADARWSSTGTANPITDPLPTITSLLISDYLDLDAPDPDLYPQGALLWNTRRGGFNVKSFQVDYFNNTTFNISEYSNTTPYQLNDAVIYNGDVYVCIDPVTGINPSNAADWSLINTNAWVTASGNKIDGSPYMGRQAQRILIVQALKAGIDTSNVAREEQIQFNLVACPQYPELTANLVALNNERNDTAFVIADTPLRLTPDEIIGFATNNVGLGLPAEDGLTTGSAYCGTFYPSCTTTDLTGSLVVQPPSHMMLRTVIRSDEVGFPWLAPAGTRRGVIDNAIQIGYIVGATGEFQTIGVNQGLRDVLYENRINPITFVPGVGITNFGNKTVTSLDSALNRINVARLVSFVRARLEVIAKQYLFEPNDQITRNEITNAITSLMLDLVAKRGIYDYLVVCDLTNNTPARIDRNELYVDIAIEPVKAVEFIYIPVRIKNTGEIASQSV